MKLSKFKAPNTFLIIFSLLFITAVLTWFIPGGEYERENVNGREMVMGNSFKYVESNPQDPADVLMAPIKGFVDASLIIGFVLIVGGAFGVFQKTKAVSSAIMGIAKAHNNSKMLRVLLIPVLMTAFSFAGATFGMSEEVIPFILVFIPLSLMLGYDSIVGVAIPFIGAGAGFAGAFLNPFTIGIAQGIAGLPIFSGIEYRIIVWVFTTAVAVSFVMIYASKIAKNPFKSPLYEKDSERRKKINFEDIDNHDGLSRTHKIVISVFVTGLIVLIFGVLAYEWWIEEISAVFIITGILVGIAGKLKLSEITDSFIQGAKDLIGTALIIALARGILIISQDGKIIDTLLYTLANPVSSLHPVFSAQAMFFVQTFLNFFVPSGSGQAVLTMPIMAPLADIVGVTRQTAVLAFQFGDGFSNMIIPTSAVTMGVLTLAEIPWEKWAKWILPLEIIFLILGLLLLVPPFFLGWN
jgi:uncharacterized ion transporter superfamily protein YfcC